MVVHLHSSSSMKPSPSLEESLGIRWVGVLLVFITPALGGFLYGYDIGATSFALKLLTSHSRHNSNAWWKHFSAHPLHQGLFVGAVSAGALLGSHLVLFIWKDNASRRTELRAAACLYLFGTLFNVLAGTFWKEWQWGWLILVAGRLLFGIGVGLVMHGAPTYMAEMTPARIRGAVVSAKETVIVLGIVTGYVVGDSHSAAGAHWTQLYWLSWLGAVPMLILTFYIPRSMRWLLLHGLRDEAKTSLNFIYHADNEQLEEQLSQLSRSLEPTQERVLTNNDAHKVFTYGTLNQNCEDTSEESSLDTLQSNSHHAPAVGSIRKLLLDPEVRPALVASMGLIVLQQLSGQPSAISYAPVLFAAAGWGGHVSVVTVLAMFFVSLNTVLLVDRVGRRRMLQACCTCLGVSLLVLSVSFWGWDQNTDNEDSFSALGKGIILVALFCFIGGYQIGFGPVTWVLVSELFPGAVRGPATALGVELNYLLNFLVQFLFPTLLNSLGWGPTFALFGSCMVYAMHFIETNVPETTGKSLEEIQIDLRRSRTKKTSEEHCLLSLEV